MACSLSPVLCHQLRAPQCFHIALLDGGLQLAEVLFPRVVAYVQPLDLGGPLLDHRHCHGQSSEQALVLGLQLLQGGPVLSRELQVTGSALSSRMHSH